VEKWANDAAVIQHKKRGDKESSTSPGGGAEAFLRNKTSLVRGEGVSRKRRGSLLREGKKGGGTKLSSPRKKWKKASAHRKTNSRRTFQMILYGIRRKLNEVTKKGRPSRLER